MMKTRIYWLGISLALLLLIATPLVSAQELPTFGLSDEDFALLLEANENSGGEFSFLFDYAFDAEISGIENAPNISMTASGTGGLDTRERDTTAFLTLTAEATQESGETQTANLEFRTLEGIIYAYDGNQPDNGWVGTTVEDFQALIGRGIERAGAGNDSLQQIGNLVESLADVQFDPTEFITLERTNDEGVNDAHFLGTLSVSDFVSSDSFASLLNLLATQEAFASQLESSGLNPGQMAMVGPMLSVLFADSTISLLQHIDLETNRVSEATLDIDFNINPALLGAGASSSSPEPISIHASLTVYVHSYGESVVVEAPEDARIQTRDELGLDQTDTSEPAFAAPTVAPIQMTPTFTPTQPAAAAPTTSPIVGGAPQPTQTLVSISSVFGLSTQGTLQPIAPIVSGGQALTANVPVTVVLDGVAPTDLTYTVEGSQVVNITVRSTAAGPIDTTVELLSADGIRLGFNDDHGSGRADLGGFDSYLNAVSLPGAGTYIVRVDSFTGRSQGSVEVLLETGVPANNVSPVVTPSSPAPSTEVIIGELEPSNRAEYPLTGLAGEVVTITVRAQDNVLDPRVALIDPAGEVLVENDDHRSQDTSLGRFDSRILNFTLPETGDYTIIIRGFGGLGGPFELTIERGGQSGTAQTVATPASTGPIAISTGVEETISGQTDSNSTFTYPISVQAGDVYTLAVRGNSGYDPVLLVLNADNQLVVGNDDHGSSDSSLARFDSRVLNYVFQDTGNFTVSVEEYDGNAGSFTLTVQLVQTGAPLGRGTEEIFTGEIEGNSTFTQTIEAQAGDYLSLTVRALSTDFNPVVSIISPDGVVMMDNDNHSSEQEIGDFDSFIRNVLIETTGTYTIEVAGIQGSSGTFALTVRTLR